MKDGMFSWTKTAMWDGTIQIRLTYEKVRLMGSHSLLGTLLKEFGTEGFSSKKVIVTYAFDQKQEIPAYVALCLAEDAIRLRDMGIAVVFE